MALNEQEITDDKYFVVETGKDILTHLDREEVYSIKELEKSTKINVRFYKNMMPEIGIALCQNCCNFFHESDFEYAFLKNGKLCPICSSTNMNTRNVSLTIGLITDIYFINL